MPTLPHLKNYIDYIPYLLLSYDPNCQNLGAEIVYNDEVKILPIFILNEEGQFVESIDYYPPNKMSFANILILNLLNNSQLNKFIDSNHSNKSLIYATLSSEQLSQTSLIYKKIEDSVRTGLPINLFNTIFYQDYNISRDDEKEKFKGDFLHEIYLMLNEIKDCFNYFSKINDIDILNNPNYSFLIQTYDNQSSRFKDILNSEITQETIDSFSNLIDYFLEENQHCSKLDDLFDVSSSDLVYKLHDNPDAYISFLITYKNLCKHNQKALKLFSKNTSLQNSSMLLNSILSFGSFLSLFLKDTSFYQEQEGKTLTFITQTYYRYKHIIDLSPNKIMTFFMNNLYYDHTEINFTNQSFTDRYKFLENYQKLFNNIVEIYEHNNVQFDNDKSFINSLNENYLLDLFKEISLFSRNATQFLSHLNLQDYEKTIFEQNIESNLVIFFIQNKLTQKDYHNFHYDFRKILHENSLNNKLQCNEKTIFSTKKTKI